MELRSGVQLLRQQWGLILAITVLAGATSAFLTSRTTPLYAAQVTLFVSASSTSDDDPGSAAAAAYQGSLLSQQKVKSYTELLKGHRVLSGVIDRLHLDTAPRQLAANVTTTVIPDTSLLTATVHDPSPQRATQIADAVGREFVKLVPRLESVPRGHRPAVKVTVVSPAELPTAPVSPRPVRNIALGCVLGLLVSFGLAAARRALDTTVKTAEQAEEISATPTLASVAFDPGARKDPLIGPGSPGPRAEAFRKLRTNLEFADVDRRHKVVLVTSAMPDEGKSLTACNLALSIAEADRRVILVDADLRRPSVARYLGLPNGIGLTSVLLGGVTLPEATQRRAGTLSVLASGPIPPNPATLLSSQRLRTVLDELRGAYDVVIVDSPPALPVADAAVLAAACDGVIVVVRHGKTRHEQVRGTVRALGVTDTPILGTVLNQAPAQRSAYYVYHGKGPRSETAVMATGGPEAVDVPAAARETVVGTAAEEPVVGTVAGKSVAITVRLRTAIAERPHRHGSP